MIPLILGENGQRLQPAQVTDRAPFNDLMAGRADSLKQLNEVNDTIS